MDWIPLASAWPPPLNISSGYGLAVNMNLLLERRYSAIQKCDIGIIVFRLLKHSDEPELDIYKTPPQGWHNTSIGEPFVPPLVTALIQYKFVNCEFNTIYFYFNLYDLLYELLGCYLNRLNLFCLYKMKFTLFYACYDLYVV